jgi:hypothetical protein
MFWRRAAILAAAGCKHYSPEGFRSGRQSRGCCGLEEELWFFGFRSLIQRQCPWFRTLKPALLIAYMDAHK